MSLTSWRGRSGRRYVATVHGAEDSEISDTAEAIVIAVRRGRDGGAEPVGAAAFWQDGSSPRRQSWLTGMRAAGATEMHVHFLPDQQTACRDAFTDLGDVARI